LEEGRELPRGELVVCEVGPPPPGVLSEALGDGTRNGKHIAKHHRIPQREVRALTELRARGVCGVAQENETRLVPAAHRHVPVLAEDHLIGTLNLGQERLGARMERPHLGLPGVEPSVAPRGDAIRADRPEEARATGLP
jgi:hypothetical protein